MYSTSKLFINTVLRNQRNTILINQNRSILFKNYRITN